MAFLPTVIIHNPPGMLLFRQAPGNPHFRDEFAVDSPLQRGVHCELTFGGASLSSCAAKNSRPTQIPGFAICGVVLVSAMRATTKYDRNSIAAEQRPKHVRRSKVDILVPVAGHNSRPPNAL